MKFTTRFAPSPTGPLHLGHAYSAILAYDMARQNAGVFLLRIEDIDQSRARHRWEAQIYDDLEWLGLQWPLPVLRQCDRQAAYDTALDQLWAAGLLYPCTCSRQDIRQALSAPQEGVPQHGPDGMIYPGTCRNKSPQALQDPQCRPRPKHVTLRLNMQKATDLAQIFARQNLNTGSPAPQQAEFTETGQAPDGQTGQILFTKSQLQDTVGDIVISRRDMGTSYHLSVVVDDAFQHVTHVVRGQDLFDATKIHVLLQSLLKHPTPMYHHHRLIRDDTGKRLAKRDDARAIARYRNDGATPSDIRALIGL